MKAPTRIHTRRLLLRKPEAADAEEIYARFSADPEVTRYMGWPRHKSLDDTEVFLAFSDAEWGRWPAGPYLIDTLSEGRLVGSTGLSFEGPTVASTGYVLAKDGWGQGYATEALTAMVDLAFQFGVRRLYALCHAEHARSMRVLQKCGFAFEEQLEGQYPNLNGGCSAASMRYVRHLVANKV